MDLARRDWDYVIVGGGSAGAALAVHGVTGLSIAGASVMPAVTGGNTNIPVIAIAERAAGFIAMRNN